MSAELIPTDSAHEQPPARVELPPAAMMEAAREQARAIVDVARQGKLVANIQGKNYPLFECLTLIGNMTGHSSEIEWCRKVDAEAMGADGWECRAIVRDSHGNQVGAAEAMCLRNERRWANADENHVRSMAQTRAQAKALRMRVGFIVTLAGFEATPAEEMPDSAPAPGRAAPAKAAPKASPTADKRWQELQEAAPFAEPADVAKALNEAGIANRTALEDDDTYKRAVALIKDTFGEVTLDGEVVGGKAA